MGPINFGELNLFLSVIFSACELTDISKQLPYLAGLILEIKGMRAV